jgi:predicted thioredoxin/glutaredoxin
LRLAALPRLAADGCGVVFHMLSALDELGRVGLTAIGTTAADAQSRVENAQELLLDAAAEYAMA